MQQGALGVSTSLQYVPGPLRVDRRDRRAGEGRRSSTAASTSRTSARSRRRSCRRSTRSFAIAERANIPAEVWHLKTAYKANWGRMPEVLKHFEAARARGLDVTANMYPYDRASNGLDACLPLWVREGGLEPMLQRLKDPALRERIKRDMDDPNAEGLGEPVVRIGRRRRRDDLDGARSRRCASGKARTSSRSARRWARIRATR